MHQDISKNKNIQPVKQKKNTLLIEYIIIKNPKHNKINILAAIVLSISILLKFF
jgi:hypothetical protein